MRGFQRRLHRDWIQGQLPGGFVGHQHRDLVHQFLELLCWCCAITQECDFVPDQRVVDDAERGKRAW